MVSAMASPAPSRRAGAVALATVRPSASAMRVTTASLRGFVPELRSRVRTETSALSGVTEGVET